MADSDFINYTPNMGLAPNKDSLREYFAANPSDTNEYMDRYLSQPEPSEEKPEGVATDIPAYNLSDILSKVNYFSRQPAQVSQKMEQYSDTIPTKSPKEFLTRYGKMAADSSQQTGIAKKLILAQLALETGWGKHINQNNIGNIKPGKSWKGGVQTLTTKEYDPKTGYTTLPQEFRAYSTPEEGFKDYISFLTTNTRYKSIIGIADPYKAADVMAKTGYATDPKYGKKLKDIMDTIDQIEQA